MAPRLNKRQQREQDELLALGRPSADAEVSSEDEAVAVPVKSAGTGFAAIFEPEEAGEESEDEDVVHSGKSKKSKKKKKKNAIAAPAPKGPSPAPPTPSGSAKKASKKKGKDKKDDRDDVDKALAELSVKYPELQNISKSTPTGSATSSSTTNTLTSLLSVSLPHLDSEAEMRKFFGAKVISASKASSSAGPSSRRQAGATQRSHLTRPQPTWWAAKQREGLSIRALTEGEVEKKKDRLEWGDVEEKWWTVEYSKKYKSVTMAFMQTVMSGDPEGFYRLLGKLPWHADTLLQLSEVYRHREEYSQAVDFVERALFTYERSFIGAFNFTSGNNRLDFDQVENRPFFLALHRQITDLQRKGCVRTAFEFARLLYSLEPWSDPHGALLHLDYLSLKAGMGQWLLDMWDHFSNWADKDDCRIDLTLLPGWAYSRALALRAKENAKKDGDHEASTEALKEAIIAFPSVVPLLADKADITLSSEIRGHWAFRIETDGSGSTKPAACLHLLSHLYAQRSFSQWKDPKLSTWFSKTVTSLFPHVASLVTSSKRRERFLKLYEAPSPRYSVYRHVMVLESSYRSLFSFIPRDVLNSKQLACDPLPPVSRISEYDQEFFHGTEDVFSVRARTRRDRIADERMLERLVPDHVFRQQLQAFFDAHPHFAERFPGGVVQFAQMAGQLPEEVLEDLMIAEAGGAPELRDGPMPGQMPGQEVFVDFTDEEDEGEAAPPPVVPRGGTAVEGRDRHEEHHVEDEYGSENDENEDGEEEDIAPMPVRLIRNIMNRFWGGGNNTIEDDSSEDGDGDHGRLVDDID